MKVAILGDTHLGSNKSSDIVHDYFELFYNDFFDYCSEHGIGAIIQTGDLFDYRREVHFNTLYRSRQYFLDRVSIPFYVISGNHDCLFKNTNRINSVDLLLKAENFHVIDQTPKTINVGGLDIDFFPWINQENIDVSLKMARDSESRFAVGHFEFSDFPMSPGNNAEGGMDHKLFSRYDQVLSGHYHTQSESGNVRYVGVPYELTWIDCNDPKGFWVLDTDLEELEFVPNKHKLFEKIPYVEDMEYDFSSVTNKYVKIVVVDKKSQKKFDDFVANIYMAKPHDLKIIEQSIVSAVSDAIDTKIDLISTKTVIDGVVDALEIELDSSILKNKMTAKYTEAMNILSQL